MDAVSRLVSAGTTGADQRQEKRDTLKDLEYRFHEEERNGSYAEAGRYANEIAKVLRGQGALRKALKWLETDYKYTTRALEARPSRGPVADGNHLRSNGDEANGGLSRATERDLAVTLQCLGEVHLSLQNWNTALSYMHRHLELAKKLKDLAEEQRACTQLGRVYLDVFIRCTDQQMQLAASTGSPEAVPGRRANPEDMDPGRALVQAKDFLQQSLKLAKQMLSHGRGRGSADGGVQYHRLGAAQRGSRGSSQQQQQPRGSNSLNAAALADAYLNMGVLFDETDDSQEALKCCALALQVCDDEEIEHIAEVRSRIHHNLGKLYMKQRDAERAKQHFTADITICNRLGLLEEEGKGWTSLGDLKFREEEYEDALRDFTRAHELVKEMEDESELLQMCEDNLAMVRAAQEQQATRDNLWNQHRKVQRMLQRTKSSEERVKLMAEDKRVLKELMELAESMQAYYTHVKAAEEYVTVAEGLGDVQSQCDAAELMAIGSYNLCRLDVAAHWYQRSLGLCRELKHIEGESVALLGLGNVLDSKRQWEQALDKFQQALKVARSEGEHGYLATQLRCLENIHYSYLLRFHDINKANEVVAQMHAVKALLIGQQRQVDSQQAQHETPGMDDSEPARGGSSLGDTGGKSFAHSRTQQFAARNASRVSAKRQKEPRDDDEEMVDGSSQEGKVAEQTSVGPTRDSPVPSEEHETGATWQKPAPTQADVEDSQGDDAEGRGQIPVKPSGPGLRDSLYMGRARPQGKNDGKGNALGKGVGSGEDVCIVPDSEDEGDGESVQSDLGLRPKRRRSAGVGGTGMGQRPNDADAPTAPCAGDSGKVRAGRKSARSSLADGAWGKSSEQGAAGLNAAGMQVDVEEDSPATVVFSRRPSLRAKKVEIAAAQGLRSGSVDQGKTGLGATSHLQCSTADRSAMCAVSPGHSSGHPVGGTSETEPLAGGPSGPGMPGVTRRQAGRRSKVMLDSPDEDAEADLFLSCLDAPDPGSSAAALGNKQPDSAADPMDNAEAVPARHEASPGGEALMEGEAKARQPQGGRQHGGPLACPLTERKGLSPATPAAHPGRSASTGMAGLRSSLPGGVAYRNAAGSPLPPAFPQQQHQPHPTVNRPGKGPLATVQVPPFVLVRILDDTLQVPLPEPSKDAMTGANSAPTVQGLMQTISELYCSYHLQEGKGVPHIQRILCGGVTLAPHLPLHLALQLPPQPDSEGNAVWEAGAPVLQAVLGGWKPLTLAMRYRVGCSRSGVTPSSTITKLLEVLQSTASLEAQQVTEEYSLAAPACNLDDPQVEPLQAVLAHGPVLSNISLPHNDLGTETLKTLVETEAAWDRMGTARGAAPDLHLDLHRNGHIGPAALSIMLTSQPLLSRLRSLDLSGCLVTRVEPTGPEVLGLALGHLIRGAPRLDSLNLNNCGLGAASLESLAHAIQDAASPQEHLPSAPGGCNLITLKLGGNAFEQCSAAAMGKLFAALASLPRLQCLDLSGLELTKPPVAQAYGAFLASLPGSLCNLIIQQTETASSTADQVMAGLLRNLEEKGSLENGRNHPVAEQSSVARAHLECLLGRPSLCEEKTIEGHGLPSVPEEPPTYAGVLANLAEQLSLPSLGANSPTGFLRGDGCPICKGRSV